MKRRHSSSDDTANKKPRKNTASDIFDDESLSNCFCSVDSLANAFGYFTGTVDMVWPLVPDKFRFHLIANCCTTDKKSHKVDVTFEGNWVKCLEANSIAIMDVLQLSLDGVTLAKPKGSRHTEKLAFNEGVILRTVRRGNPRFVNTWQLQQKPPELDLNDWFATPVQPVTGPLSAMARRAPNGHPQATPITEEDTKASDTTRDTKEPHAQQIEHPDSKQKTLSKEESTPNSPHLKHREAQKPVIQAPGPSHILSSSVSETRITSPPISKKKSKKERRRQQAAAIALGNVSLPDRDLPEPAGPSTAVTMSHRTSDARDAKPNTVDLGCIALDKSDKIDKNSPKGWLAELRSHQRRYTYITLKEATETKAGRAVNIIGVVKNYKGPYQTSTKDWSMTFFLQDPSLVDDDDEFHSFREFSVVFFQKFNMKEFLPQAATGDILLLRNVRIQDYKGISGVGYQGKVQSATYSISRGYLLRHEMDDTELAAGSFVFPTFFNADDPEKDYSKRLGEWWREKNQSSAGTEGQVYHLEGNSQNSSRWRELRQLCDAGPEVEPSGYFDCVFEVVNGYQGDNNVYSLYATDYTKNLQVPPCQAQWCPVGLNDYVVLFELWDGACQKSQYFKTGTFWHVKNARMIRKDIVVKGKIVQDKFRQVSPDDDFAPLQALLQRKKKWEEEHASKSSAFPHKLIRDAKVGEYINCTVKLVRVTRPSNEVLFHVTDYTPHPELSTYRHDKEWSQGLEGRILSILLTDAQVQYADRFSQGTYLFIKNLRLTDYFETRLRGMLGGSDVLVSKFGPHSQNEHLQALREREAHWEQEKHSEAKPPAQSPETAKSIAQINSTIKQLDANQKETLKTRITARVVDHYPRSPEKWIRAWCSRCKKKIPDNKLACHDCQDVDHDFVQHRFELVLLVQDDEGTQTELYVKETCKLLQDLQIEPGQKSLSELIKKLKPLLGELGEQGNSEERSGARLSFIIGQFEHPSHGLFRVLLSVEGLVSLTD